MNNGSDIEVQVTANVDSLDRGMDQAAKSVEDGAQRMDGSLKTAGDSISGVSTTVRSAFASVAAVAAAAFSFVAIKNAADETVKYTEAAMDLGRAMGVSATDASVWISVLDDIGATQGELSAASRGLTMNLTKNEDSLNAMGLATRDANGKLRPMNDLMLDAIAVVNSYKEGTDRNAAAQEVFGRSVNGSSKLLLASREAAEETERKMRDLGMVVGQDNVQAWKDYDQASDDAHLTGKALQITIGQALIPVMTAFKSSLVSIGPELVKVARVAMETFLGVIDLARMVKQAFVSVGSDIGAVAAAAAMALRGDFAGAMNVFKERAADAIKETQKLKDLWNGTGDSFLGKYRQKFTASDAPAEGGNDFQAPPGASGSKGKSKKADGPIDALGSGSYITSDKGVAEMIREQQEDINRMNGEMAADAERAAKAATDAYKRATEQKIQVDLIWMRNAVDARLAVVDADEDAAHHAVEMGVMTHEELLQQQIGFEQRRNEIILQAMNERLAMIDPTQDPVTYAQVKAEIEAAERQHQAVMTEIKNGAELERNQYALQATNAVQNSIANSLQKVMMGQMTLAQGLKSMWQGITTSIAQMFAQMAAKNIATMLMQAAQGKAIRAKEIVADAYAAAAGAYKAVVGIPYVGPFLAPVAAAAAFGGVMAFSSAAGGYDIPAGVNPMTQLHEREMVLPAKHADVIRGLAEGGAGGTGPMEVHIHQNIKAWDSVDARRAMMDNQSALVEALKNAHRNGFR
ncbi:MAG: hypothetical protein ABIK08_04100 [Pseudomonadota bacterium]